MGFSIIFEHVNSCLVWRELWFQLLNILSLGFVRWLVILKQHKDYLIYLFPPDEKMEPLSWERRVHVALDVARGLEYLHDGVMSICSLFDEKKEIEACLNDISIWSSSFLFQAVPPVLHRDIKSSNILLDQSMRARVSKLLSVFSFVIVYFCSGLQEEQCH